ncbi:MAG: hypothetical protein NTX56_15605 [Proteobacteria bacterium]|nr:hypothetical protein [Pseudomonadota bacterium]
MSRKIISLLPQDPDPLVFWLTTTLCALFMVFAPGAPGALVAL